MAHSHDTAAAGQETERFLTRPQVCDFVRERFGLSLAVRTLEDAAIPYRVIGRNAVYSSTDVLAHYQRKLAQAPRRVGGKPVLAASRRTGLPQQPPQTAA
jgi:hypothetical protein